MKNINQYNPVNKFIELRFLPLTNDSFIFSIYIWQISQFRGLSMYDATTILNLMNYEISKYLYEVPYPYKIDDDALNFIKSSYDDFRLGKAITFAIDYKNKLQSFQLLSSTIGIKDIDYINKKANIGYWIGIQYQG